jgi:DNA-binding NtrC family response regulator
MIRVLLVDDDGALKKKLDANGMNVTIVSRAADALALSKKELFGVAVLDIRLPGLNGVDLLGRLKHIQKALGVIIHTDYAAVVSAVRYMKQGAHD